MDKPTSGVIPKQKHGLVLQPYMITMNCLCKSFKLQGFFCGTCYMLHLLIAKTVFNKRFKAYQNSGLSHVRTLTCNKHQMRGRY